MFELTINEKVYLFKFGMGFLRNVNKLYQKDIDGIKDAKDNIGLQMVVAGLRAKDAEFLVKVLDAANIGQNPRVTPVLLDSYIDDENTDIDALFEQVIEGLRTANATKNVVRATLERLEAQENQAQ